MVERTKRTSLCNEELSDPGHNHHHESAHRHHRRSNGVHMVDRSAGGAAAAASDSDDAMQVDDVQVDHRDIVPVAMTTRSRTNSQLGRRKPPTTTNNNNNAKDSPAPKSAQTTVVVAATPGSKRLRKVSERSIPEGSDSASLDSLNSSRDFSDYDLMDLIDVVLKPGQDNNNRLQLERLLRLSAELPELPSNLEGSRPQQLLDALMRHRDLTGCAYGQIRWLGHLLAGTVSASVASRNPPALTASQSSPTNDAAAAVLRRTEDRSVIEPLLARSPSIAQQSLRLRGKLDLLRGHLASSS